MPQREPLIHARLSNWNCMRGRFFPLRGHLDPDSVWTPSELEMLVSFEAEADCVTCYVAPETHTKRLEDLCCVGDPCDLADWRIVLCLPLSFAAARTISGHRVQGRYVVGIILPQIDLVPDFLRPRADCLVPPSSHGVWLLECQTASAQRGLLDRLQQSGCVMHGLEERYVVGEFLGAGSFSEVYYLEDKFTGTAAAAKLVPKSGEDKDKLLMKEVCMLRQASHQFVLKFIGFFEAVDPTDEKEVWVIVTEFVAGGELFSRVRHHGKVSGERAAYVTFQLLAALQCLHQRGIVHRDIKTENVILVDEDADEVKLVDFGLATPVNDREAMNMRCGSPGYIAPEVLRNEEYDVKVDCFSVGVLLYILLVGQGPFRGKNVEETLRRNLRCTVSRRALFDVSDEAKDVVIHLLASHPEMRPTASQGLEHPWLRKWTMDSEFSSVLAVGTQNAEHQFETRNNLQGATTASTRASFSSGDAGLTENMSVVPENAETNGADPSAMHTFASLSVVFGSSTRDDFPNFDDSSPKCLLDDTRVSNTECPHAVQSPDFQEDQDIQDEGGDLQVDPAILRTQTPLWTKVHSTLSSLRSHGLSPRQTMESKGRRSNGRFTGQTHDGEVDLAGRRSNCIRNHWPSKRRITGQVNGIGNDMDAEGERRSCSTLGDWGDGARKSGDMGRRSSFTSRVSGDMSRKSYRISRMNGDAGRRSNCMLGGDDGRPTGRSVRVTGGFSDRASLGTSAFFTVDEDEKPAQDRTSHEKGDIAMLRELAGRDVRRSYDSRRSSYCSELETVMSGRSSFTVVQADVLTECEAEHLQLPSMDLLNDLRFEHRAEKPAAAVVRRRTNRALGNAAGSASAMVHALRQFRTMEASAEDGGNSNSKGNSDVTDTLVPTVPESGKHSSEVGSPSAVRIRSLVRGCRRSMTHAAHNGSSTQEGCEVAASRDASASPRRIPSICGEDAKDRALKYPGSVSTTLKRLKQQLSDREIRDHKFSTSPAFLASSEDES